MTDVAELYNLIEQHHGALAVACRMMAQSFAAMADLCVAIGATQNELAPESEPESPTCPTGKHALTHGGTPTNPVYYACNCLSHEGNEIAAVVAATDPTVSLPSNVCEPDCALVAQHDGPCLDAEDAAVVNPEEMRQGAWEPPQPSRKKTDMTAAQWATSKHFLAYVKRTEPFLAWSAEEQNAARDRFVAAQPADLVLNRWGQRFAKFCGVST